MAKSNKLILLTCLGSIMEYYDFIIYGMMAIYISEVFFPNTSLEITYLKTFSILSIGYLVRPLGGYLFGVISDLYGRKKTIMLVMMVMACSTFLIGCLPNYLEIGIMAPILLTAARILQGLSFGAEIPSMTTIIKESTQQKNAGKYFGLVLSSTSVGALMASFVVYLLGSYFTQDEIKVWAWRLPFLIGSILAFFILFIRNRIDETSDFLMVQKQAKIHTSSALIFRDLFKNYWKNLVFGACVTLFFSFLIIFTTYIPVYLSQQYSYHPNDIFSKMTLGILACVFISPLFGIGFNKLNKFKVLTTISILFVLFLFVSLQVLKLGSTFALLFFLVGYQIFISAYATTAISVLPDIFPIHIRSTGIGICYNVAYAIASVTPLILTPIIQPHNHQWVVLLASVLVITIASLGAYYLNTIQNKLKSNLV